MKRFIMIIVSIAVFCMGMDSFAKTSSHDERLNLIHRKFGDDFENLVMTLSWDITTLRAGCRNGCHYQSRRGIISLM